LIPFFFCGRRRRGFGPCHSPFSFSKTPVGFPPFSDSLFFSVYVLMTRCSQFFFSGICTTGAGVLAFFDSSPDRFRKLDRNGLRLCPRFTRSASKRPGADFLFSALSFGLSCCERPSLASRFSGFFLGVSSQPAAFFSRVPVLTHLAFHLSRKTFLLRGYPF